MIFLGNLSRLENLIAEELKNAVSFYASFDQWTNNEFTPEVGVGKLLRNEGNTDVGIIGSSANIFQTAARRVTGDVDLNNSQAFKFYNNLGDLPFSDSVWFNMTDVGDQQGIFFNSDFNAIQAPSLFYNNGNIQCQLRSRKGGSLAYLVLNCTVALSINQWYFLTRTYNGDENNPIQKCYLNGVEILGNTSSSGATYTGMDHTSNAINIGGGAVNNVPFRGRLDEFCVFKNKELNLTEHKYLYNNGLGRQYPFN